MFVLVGHHICTKIKVLTLVLNVCISNLVFKRTRHMTDHVIHVVISMHLMISSPLPH